MRDANLEMSNAKENKDAGQGVPLVQSAVEESQLLFDAQVQVQPELSSSPLKKTSNHVENGKAVPPAGDDSMEPGTAAPPAGDDSLERGKEEPPAVDDSVKSEKAEPPAVDGIMEPGKAAPPAEDNSMKPEKAEPAAGDKSVEPEKAVPPVEDNSVKPEKTEPPAEDNGVKPSKEEFPAEDKSVRTGKVDQPAEGNSVKPEKLGISAEDSSVKQGKANRPSDNNSVKPEVVSDGIPQPDVQNTLRFVPVEADPQILNETECGEASVAKMEIEEFTQSNKVIENDNNVGGSNIVAAEVKPEAGEMADTKTCNNGGPVPISSSEPTMPLAVPANTKAEIKNEFEVENKADEKQTAEPADNGNSNSKHMCFLDADHSYDGNESGTEQEQSAFMKELENFFRERSMEFKPPKFYGEGLNCLKLWRAVTRLGGYDKVTSCKLWRQVGESFKPPKTCTTVSWTFRGFYEKALLDYERHKIKGGELNVPIASQPEPMNIENQCIQASASGRARRDAAARAMQGWHSQRLLGNGEVSDPIIKDRNSVSMQKREKQPKSINLSKRKRPPYMDNDVRVARSKVSKLQLDTAVVDIGPPADWVKVNVQKTKDCFEVYALVPGLLREEVRVQSDPAGRLVISGEPEHPNNPWGVTPFKKVVSLPSRIDPHQTSAVVTLHGQLFVRVPFEQSE